MIRPDPYGHVPNALDRINARLNETRDRLHEEILRQIAEQERQLARPDDSA